MKEIVDLLQKKNLVFKSLKPIDIKLFNSRKKIAIYLGVDLKSYYASILHIRKKSKILQKEALELMAFHEKLERLNDSEIKSLVVTNSIPLADKGDRCDKITVLSVGELLGEAIRRIHSEDSVSYLFV